MSVTYTATLSVREETVLFVSSRLHAGRLRRGTRTGTRALGCFKQADVQQMCNKVRNGIRAVGERGNSLLKTTFKALRNVSPCPWKIGKITAAALVLLHAGHGRTT
jgi:hypothetical protein